MIRIDNWDKFSIGNLFQYENEKMLQPDAYFPKNYI